jgi:hypothetical protein
VTWVKKPFTTCIINAYSLSNIRIYEPSYLRTHVSLRDHVPEPKPSHLLHSLRKVVLVLRVRMSWEI